ncbi:MAG: YibE/F family protein, partial [Parcubacteria group bacterium]|nr:YibE/F family protein [Parcubacteria group bacterium]
MHSYPLRVFALGIFVLLLVPFVSHAQGTLALDSTTVVKARVVSVSNERTVTIPGTETLSETQTLDAEILSGEESGKVVTFENDYIQLEEGQTFFLRHTTSDLDGTDYYSVSDPYRLNVLLGLAVGFVLLTFIFGGLPGVRGLASLLGSLVLISYVLIPGILNGYSPILVSIGVSSLIIVLGSYVTHGFNRTTSSAVLGMIGTVLITGAAAYWVVHAA